MGFLFQEAQQQSFPLTQVEEFSLIIKIKWSSDAEIVAFMCLLLLLFSLFILKKTLMSGQKSW